MKDQEMINPKVIEAFLFRPLDNYDFIKEVPDGDLTKALLDLGIERGSLWKHQAACLLLMRLQKRFMLHVDMGGGKTLTILKAIQARKTTRENPRVIVFVPFLAATETWVAESKKRTPDLTCTALIGTGEQNVRDLSNLKADIFVMCYQSAVAMLADTRAKKWNLNTQTIKDAFSGFNTLILDEVQKCKSPQSLTYRMCRVLAQQCPYVYGLTGTPFGNDLQDLWPQFNLIDFGETLGPSLGFYREVFFTQKRNYWGGFEYAFKQKLLPRLTRMIKNTSIRYSIEDLIDLPEKIYNKIRLDLPKEIAKYVQTATEEMRAALKDNDLQVVEQNYLRLRQLSSGFMTLKGEDDAKVQVSLGSNPKLDTLSDICAGLPSDAKCVVFHHFVYSSTLISDKLRELRSGLASIYGGSKDPVGELRRFQNDKACRFLVLNSKSGSSSLNLQMANYVIFFEQPDSPIDRQQCERRVWRPGQEKPVFIYDLFVQKTVDERIYNSNLAGETLLKRLLDRKEEL
jgi:SNF2 family DNA or RNA helicase